MNDDGHKPAVRDVGSMPAAWTPWSRWVHAYYATSGHTPRTQMVACALSTFADEDLRGCAPAMADLVAAAKTDGDTVRERLGLLERSGWIIQVRRPGRTYYYTFLPPPDLEAWRRG